MKYVSNTTKKPIVYKQKTITPGASLMLTDEGEVIDNVTVSCTERLRDDVTSYVDHRLGEYSRIIGNVECQVEKLKSSGADITLNVSCVFSALKSDLTKYFLGSSCDNCSSLISYACSTKLTPGIYALVGTPRAKTSAGFTAETPKVEMTIPYTFDGKCVSLSYFVTYCVPVLDTYKICTSTSNRYATYIVATNDRSIQPKGLCACYKYVDSTGADVCKSDIDKKELLPKEVFTAQLDECIMANLQLSISDMFKKL